MKKININFAKYILSVCILNSCSNIKNDSSIKFIVSTNSKSNIANGILLQDDQLPQAIMYLNPGKGVCSATLVGPRVLITAAHCGETGDKIPFFETVDAQSEFAKLSGLFLKNPLHDKTQFNPQDPVEMSSRGDIAFIILSAEVKNIDPIRITKEFPKLNERVVITGHGAPTVLSKQLGFTNVSKIGEYGYQVLDFNAQNAYQVPHSGDSGGAAYRVINGSLFLFGIHSIGTPLDILENRQESGYVKMTSEILSFMQKVSNENNIKICGINYDCNPVTAIQSGFSYKTKLTVKPLNTNPYNLKLWPVGNAAIIKQSITSDVVYVGYGKVEDFANVDVKNKIVLIARGEIALSDKLAHAKKAGAVAVIIHNKNNDEFDGALSEPSNSIIFAVSKDDGDRVLLNLKEANVIRLSIDTTQTEYRFDAPTKERKIEDQTYYGAGF